MSRVHAAGRVGHVAAVRYPNLLAAGIAAALLVTVAGCGEPEPVQPKDAEHAQEQTGGIQLRTTEPPWPAPTEDSRTYVEAAGLPALKSEGTIVHYHAHLDVIVDGKPVEVPAGIGVIFKGGKAVAISPLHTHQPNGVLHVEAERNAEFTLGQVFTEWNLRLSQTCIGGLCADATHELQFAIDGVSYDGDPLKIALKPHQEIAILYGEKGKTPEPPTSYDFAPGE